MKGLTVLRAEHRRRDRYAGSTLDGSFRIDDRIGGGGEGAVYAGALASPPGTPVAIKIRFERGTDEVVVGGLPRDPLRREHELLNRLQGACFPRTYRCGRTDCGHTYIARELIPGVPLDAVCRDGRSLGLSRLLALLIRACDAVIALHEAGYAHGDVKPGNFIATGPLSGDGAVKLLDYGAVWPLGLTVVGEALSPPSGTVAYMAPEQAGGEHAGPAADMYGLAATAYELLTGKQVLGPAAKMEKAAQEYLAGTGPIPHMPLGPLRPDLPTDLSFAVSAALSRDPRRRGTTVEAFRRLLRDGLSVRPDLSWDPTLPVDGAGSGEPSWLTRIGRAFSGLLGRSASDDEPSRR